MVAERTNTGQRGARTMGARICWMVEQAVKLLLMKSALTLRTSYSNLPSLLKARPRIGSGFGQTLALSTSACSRATSSVS